MAELRNFPGGHRPIPRRIAYPSDYGLAIAAENLMRDYGQHGAINRLIEMAELLARGESPVASVALRRRVSK